MLLGIVDIGSNAIKYKIFNTKDNSLVEYYREPLRLGKDAFTQGFLSELTLKQLAIVLERFKRVFSEKNIEKQLSKNPILVTALNREIGYEKAALIAKKAYKENRPIIDVAHEETGISIKRLNSILDPKKLTKGGI